VKITCAFANFLVPAFSPKVLEPLIPTFSELAHELIDGFCERGSAEFMSEFAEAYSARVITGLLGIDKSHWREIADLATELGYVFSVTIKDDLRSYRARAYQGC
jgi:cytochrome P450